MVDSEGFYKLTSELVHADQTAVLEDLGPELDVSTSSDRHVCHAYQDAVLMWTLRR